MQLCANSAKLGPLKDRRRSVRHVQLDQLAVYQPLEPYHLNNTAIYVILARIWVIVIFSIYPSSHGDKIQVCELRLLPHQPSLCSLVVRTLAAHLGRQAGGLDNSLCWITYYAVPGSLPTARRPCRPSQASHHVEGATKDETV